MPILTFASAFALHKEYLTKPLSLTLNLRHSAQHDTSENLRAVSK
jgi:hypothetical protein